MCPLFVSCKLNIVVYLIISFVTSRLCKSDASDTPNRLCIIKALWAHFILDVGWEGLGGMTVARGEMDVARVKTKPC